MLSELVEDGAKPQTGQHKILKAASREELVAQYEGLKDECELELMTGVIGYNIEERVYVLRVDFI